MINIPLLFVCKTVYEYKTTIKVTLGYVVMDRAKLDANYDDVKNVRPNFYEDIMDSVPRVYQDRDTYDDVSNVRAPSDYEDVLNVRIDPSKDKLVS